MTRMVNELLEQILGQILGPNHQALSKGNAKLDCRVNFILRSRPDKGMEQTFASGLLLT